MPAHRAAQAAALVAVLAVATAARAEERPFVFANDALTPRQWNVDALYRGTWGLLGGDAVRPFGAGALGAAGSVHELQAEVGLLPRLSVRVYGLLSLGLRDGEAYTTAGAEVRARLVGGEADRFHLTLAAGVLREFNGYPTLQGRLVASGSLDRLRLTADVLVERSFRPRADAVDVIAAVGAAYQVVDAVRLGVEYVGQDFEALWDPREIEGVRQMLGPTVAVNLAAQRFQAQLGPAFGLSPNSPPVTVRLGAMYTF